MRVRQLFQALAGGGQVGEMGDSVRESVAGDQLIDRRFNVRGVRQIPGPGDGASQRALAYEGLCFLCQIDTDDLLGDAIERGGDGRTQITGSARHPNGLAFERVPRGLHGCGIRG